MAYEPIFDIAGNILGDPELRFTPNGVAVCNFRVGINDARPEQNNNKKVQPLVAECTVWREMAENVAETLEARMRILAKVRMHQIGAYIAKNDDKYGFYKAGDPVGTLKLEVLEIGPSNRWQKGQMTKVAGNQNQQGGGNQQGGQTQGQQSGWGGNQQNQGGGWGQNPNANQQGGNDPWAGGQHPGQQGGNQQSQQGQDAGWGSDQGWGGGNSGNDPWGGQ